MSTGTSATLAAPEHFILTDEYGVSMAPMYRHGLKVCGAFVMPSSLSRHAFDPGSCSVKYQSWGFRDDQPFDLSGTCDLPPGLHVLFAVALERLTLRPDLDMTVRPGEPGGMWLIVTDGRGRQYQGSPVNQPEWDLWLHWLRIYIAGGLDYEPEASLEADETTVKLMRT